MVKSVYKNGKVIILKRIITSLLVTLVAMFIGYYVAIPAINIKSGEFWSFIFYLIIIFFVVYFFAGIKAYFKIAKQNPKKANPLEYLFKKFFRLLKYNKNAKTVFMVFVGVLIVGLGAIYVTSSKIFNAKKYQSLLKVEDSNFNEDISEISLSQIPIVDRDTATRLGSRKIGEVVELVSQFDVSSYYTQINYKSTPTRVSPLEYADVFKWFSNKKDGIPYYVMIDMATQKTNLIKLDKGMKYLPCEYFNRDLKRHVRFKYPTKMFQSITFEIDDNGHPFWSVSYYDYKIGFLGGKDIFGIIMVDAVTGEMTDYPVDKVPQWVDTVYDSGMIIEQADYWGSYKNGYINSFIGQKNVVTTTDGYNYIALNDDVWLYTGITSVSNDASNIGFILVNMRTKETKKYTINGAEELSAMSSAEGMIQEKGYTATFPILVNIADTPSYFISLKDAAGLVKAYSFVSVANYQIVGVSDTIEGASEEYLRLLASNGQATASSDGTVKKDNKTEISVSEISSVVIDGNTVYYIKSSDGSIYIADVKSNSSLPFAKPGQKITVKNATKIS